MLWHGIGSAAAFAVSIQPPLNDVSGRDRMPSHFWGHWATDSRLCHSPEAPGENWVIDAISMTTAEGGVEVNGVDPIWREAWSYRFEATMSGGGEQWQAELLATMSADDKVITIEDPSDRSGMPSTLYRCTDPVPEPFLGEWAAKPERECGRPYASILLTPGGFVMPEVEERIVSLQSKAENPREVMMEAEVSIAGTNYRERRVLRLGADMQTLDLVSLGQIETGSEDPDWTPDPDAHFRDVTSPKRVERLQRCPQDRAGP